MRSILAVFVISSTLVLQSAASHAETPLKFSLMGFFPFGGMTSEQKFEGIYWDIMQEIGRLSGVEFVTTMLPITRLRNSINEGSADVTISGASSSLNAGAVSLGIVGCSSIIVQTTKGANIKTLDDLKGREIAFARNGFLLKMYGKKFELRSVESNSSQSMFAMLERGRVEGIFISDVVIDSYILKNPQTSVLSKDWQQRLGPRVLVRKIPSHVQISALFPDAAVKQRLLDAVVEGQNTGAFEQIYARYGIQTRGKC
jgi:ABC-type amino acid transport substrate-binding protein